MTTPLATAHDILIAAARMAGLDSTSAELIRDGSNVIYRLSGDNVARIGRTGTQETAEREVRVSRWLTTAGLPVVHVLNDVPQPTMINDRPVTWWKFLPEHRPATPGELGAVLRSLHALAPPDDLDLPVHDPFSGLSHRINQATALDNDDRIWLTHRLAQLRERYRRLPMGKSYRVIHGDAWQGNIAVPDSTPPTLLDLEHVSVGCPDWDLVPIAVDYTDFVRVTTADYEAFVTAYGGYDVIATPAFRTLADIEELRWVSFVLSKSATSTSAARETRHRIACLRGDTPRPWKWAAF
ncbi:MAG: aminoglycoside phosphotransferase family protein [Actinomycetota bacterium]|nr:aminoglycoside phosphotransferase family protein [Actinomycetota bacterium]